MLYASGIVVAGCFSTIVQAKESIDPSTMVSYCQASTDYSKEIKPLCKKNAKMVRNAMKAVTGDGSVSCEQAACFLMASPFGKQYMQSLQQYEQMKSNGNACKASLEKKIKEDRKKLRNPKTATEQAGIHALGGYLNKHARGDQDSDGDDDGGTNPLTVLRNSIAKATAMITNIPKILAQLKPKTSPGEGGGDNGGTEMDIGYFYGCYSQSRNEVPGFFTSVCKTVKAAETQGDSDDQDYEARNSQGSSAKKDPCAQFQEESSDDDGDDD